MKRRLSDLQEQGAEKDETGAWRVTPQQLLAVGLHPGKPTAPEAEAPRAQPEGTATVPQGSAPVQPDPALAQRVVDLEQQLAVERVRRETAEQLAAERERALERADVAWRVLEARQDPTPAQLVAEAATPAPAAAQPPRRRSWWQQRGA